MRECRVEAYKIDCCYSWGELIHLQYIYFYYYQNVILICIQGIPGSPTIIGAQDVGDGSITVSWVEGFSGGYDQTTHIQIRSSNRNWTETNTYTIAANDPPLLRKTTITDMVGTNVLLRLFASNQLGISEMSEVWNLTTQGRHIYLLFNL